jgi:hypothetical protein
MGGLPSDPTIIRDCAQTVSLLAHDWLTKVRLLPLLEKRAFPGDG